MKAAVITLSDRASSGVYEDLSGPALIEVLQQGIVSLTVEYGLVPDEKDAILSEYKRFSDCDLIVTTGGTGLGPRDITPDVTADYCDRSVPGISQYLIGESLKITVNAALSRIYAGTHGQTLIINLPGSVKAARECGQMICKIAPHAVKMIAGEGH
ncbi:MAG: MogA/MoaB family molybdenum cofactor biosynthesis protein [Spirochaetales bacterium]|nr:MogA/MoaB family molybdenum cofactor biosynthesis protein [Spirochaetales bacterium]